MYYTSPPWYSPPWHQPSWYWNPPPMPPMPWFTIATTTTIDPGEPGADDEPTHEERGVLVHMNDGHSEWFDNGSTFLTLDGALSIENRAGEEVARIAAGQWVLARLRDLTEETEDE